MSSWRSVLVAVRTGELVAFHVEGLTNRFMMNVFVFAAASMPAATNSPFIV